MSVAVLERTLQDSVELETVACDLCGSRTWKERYRMADLVTEVTPFEFPVVRCSSCGLVWVNPRPTQAAMADFYAKDYHRGRDQAEHLARYGRQLDLVGPLEHEAWLDVGCARGDFLSYVLDRNPGVKAVGVDAFSPGVGDDRIEFHQGTLHGAKLEAGRFDLVSAWAVLEHVHEPLAYFQEVARLLRPGGRFLFVVTNSESLWSRRAYREDVPRHTYHFSHATLREYARRTGFEVERQHCVAGFFDGRGKGTFKWGLSHAFGLDWRSRRARRYRPHHLALKALGQLVDQVVFALPWEVWLDRSGILFTELRLK